MTALQRFVGFFVVVMAAAPAPQAQEVEERLAERWRWRELTPPHGAVTHDLVAPDRRGRLLSSAGGHLALYDGASWRRIPAEALRASGTPLQVLDLEEGWLVCTAEPRVIHLAESGAAREFSLPPLPPGLKRYLHRLADGRTFVLTTEGLLEYERGEFSRRRSVPSPGKVLALEADPEGRLLLAGIDGLFREESGGWTPLERQGVEDTARYRTALRVGDEPWFFPDRSSSAQPILRYAAGRLEPVRPEVLCESAVVLDDGSLVLSQRNGDLRVLRQGTWHAVEPLADLGQSSQVLKGPGGRLLALTSARRLWVCDLASDRWRVLAPQEGITNVNALAWARAGGLWVGSAQGLLRWTEAGIAERFSEVPGREPGTVTELGTVTAVCEDSQGALWVGSGSSFNGALRFDGQRWEHVLDPIGPFGVHAIERTADGDLWFLLLGDHGAREPSGGLLRFDGTTWRRFTSADGLPSDRCYALTSSAVGGIEVATRGGAARLEGERWSPIEELPRKALRTLTRTRDGALWAGCGSLTLGLHRAFGPPLELTKRHEELRVGALLDTEEGLWIAAQHGLFLQRGPLLHAVSDEPGAPVRTFLSMLAAPDGTKFLGSVGRGLVRYRADDLQAPSISELSVALDEQRREYLVSWQALDFWETTPRSEVSCRWRLDGGPWSDPVSAGTLRMRVEPGPHRVELVAFDLAGNLSAVPAALDFGVPVPAPVKTLLVLGGLAAVLAVGLVGWRMRGARTSAPVPSADAAGSLAEHAALPFARLDPQGRFLQISPALARFLGRLPEWQGASLGELLQQVEPSSRGRAASLLRALEEPSAVSCELSFALPEGTSPRLFVSLAPKLDAKGLLAGFDLVALDPSLDPGKGQEREELERSLRKAHELMAFGQLAAGVAHDFNNLMTVIRGNADLLDREQANRAAAPSQRISDIQQAANRATALSRQLLAFGRPQGLELRRLDLGQTVRDALPMLARVLPPGIALEPELAAEPLPVDLDESAFQRVLLNLAINARDAMPTGGSLKVGTSAQLVDDALARAHPRLRSGLHAVLSVSDTGQGMSAAVLARAFEPFFSTKEPAQGSGLGLSVVQGIVEQSGGAILVDSAPGCGTCFKLYFPAPPQDPPGALPARRGEGAPIDASLRS